MRATVPALGLAGALVPVVVWVIVSCAAARAEEAAARFKIVEVSGEARIRDAAPPMPGQPVAADAVLVLGPGGRARVATACGAIVVVDGPREGVLTDLLGAPAAGEPCPAPDGDPRKALRRKLILSFLERSPERVFRGGGQAGRADPLRLDLEAPPPACFAAGRPVVLTGDVERLGDTLEIRNEAGAQALTFFDPALPGWPWPQDIAVSPGLYTVATRLQEVRLDLRALPGGGAEPGPDLALALAEAGCLAQARLLLRTLPPDQEIARGP